MIVFGVFDVLMCVLLWVGVFCLIVCLVEECDEIFEFFFVYDGVQLVYDDCIGVIYDDVRVDFDVVFVMIVVCFKVVEVQCDVVVIVGSDYIDVGSFVEFGFNVWIVVNFVVFVFFVLSGCDQQCQVEQFGIMMVRVVVVVGQIGVFVLFEFVVECVEFFVVVVNRVDFEVLDEVVDVVRVIFLEFCILVWVILEDCVFVVFFICGIFIVVDGMLLKGDDDWFIREVLNIVVVGMLMVNVFFCFIEEVVVVIFVDCIEVLFVVLFVDFFGMFLCIVGIILNGFFLLFELIVQLFDGFVLLVFIIMIDLGIYDIVVCVMSI